ncbi:MAG: DUF3006 domain-containing protein [Euryarchaeota archaeon]|nr:DUF3006 domain-containing protein [Euryarchaeota archaeon]
MSERVGATVDRIEGEIAVILIERDGEVTDEKQLPAAELPEEACEGSVLACTLSSGEITGMTVDAEETRKRRERAQSRFDRLSRRPDET